MEAEDLTGANLAQRVWRKSRRSGDTGGNCVEVAAFSNRVAIRDSKNPAGPILVFAPDAWRSFLGSIRRGETAF